MHDYISIDMFKHIFDDFVFFWFFFSTLPATWEAEMAQKPPKNNISNGYYINQIDNFLLFEFIDI